MPQQDREAAAGIGWFGQLPYAGFQLAQHGIAGDEAVAGSAPLVDTFTDGRNFSHASRQVIAVEQEIGHPSSPIWRRTCALDWARACSRAAQSNRSSAASLSAQTWASNAKSRSIWSAVASPSSAFSTRRQSPSCQSSGKGSRARISPFCKIALGIATLHIGMVDSRMYFIADPRRGGRIQFHSAIRPMRHGTRRRLPSRDRPASDDCHADARFAVQTAKGGIDGFELTELAGRAAVGRLAGGVQEDSRVVLSTLKASQMLAGGRAERDHRNNPGWEA